MRFILLIFSALIFFSVNSFAQIDTKDENLIEKKVETIAENTEEEIDYTMLVDQLTQYIQKPLNLNSATFEELDELALLSDIQINNLLEHIAQNGKLLSLYELQSIDGFDLAAIRSVSPYVTVSGDLDNAKFTLRDIFKYGKHDVFFRYQQILEQQEGYAESDSTTNENSRFAGNPARLYMRYRFTYSNHVSWGITAEKDQGEEFFKGSQKQGFDFYSGHFFLKNIGHMKALAIGDFQAQFGQGLTFWSGLAFGKTADGTSMKRNAIGLKPYTAVDENLFLRGVGTTWQLGNFHVTGFFSHKKIDGSVAVDSTKDEVATITSFLTSGLHRTPSELDKRKALSETIMGGNLCFVKRRLRIGVTAVHYIFGTDYQRTDELYNRYEFNGKQNTNVGIDYNYVFRNFNFFGETTVCANGSVATTNGVLMSLDPRVTFVAMYRSFPKDFQAVYANAISENTRVLNEKATYFGFRAQILKNWTLQGYMDIFKFPWLRYQVNAPSKGYEYLAQLTFSPSKTLEAYFRIRRQMKEINTNDEELTVDYLDEYSTTNYRFNITYKISSSVQLRNRVEHIVYERGNDGKEKGWLMYQDVTWKALKSPLSLSFRYALFDTDTYNARLYAYENDVLYAFSIPAYYYKGSRTYLTLRYNIVRGIDVWLRYAVTFYNNRNSISSGTSEIQGNTKSEIKAQIRFRF
ncbi:MAG: hypothetical protein POELPBGB_01977 [Bacteroidia bacterium]|nr:hypothetical protein [Bacteroidia bacterium]